MHACAQVNSGRSGRVLHFLPDSKSSVSFTSIAGCSEKMPLGSEVLRHDALHLQKPLRMLG